MFLKIAWNRFSIMICTTVADDTYMFCLLIDIQNVNNDMIRTLTIKTDVLPFIAVDKKKTLVAEYN